MQLANINFPVTDLAAAKRVFATLLGAEPHTDTPYYVGYNVDGLEIALNPGGAQQGITGATPFYAADDIERACTELEEAGARVVTRPTQVGGGTTIAVLEVDGNSIGLIRAAGD